MEKDIIKLMGLLMAYDIPFYYDKWMKFISDPSGEWQCDYSAFGFVFWHEDRFIADELSPEQCISRIFRFK